MRHVVVYLPVRHVVACLHVRHVTVCSPQTCPPAATRHLELVPGAARHRRLPGGGAPQTGVVARPTPPGATRSEGLGEGGQCVGGAASRHTTQEEGGPVVQLELSKQCSSSYPCYSSHFPFSGYFVPFHCCWPFLPTCLPPLPFLGSLFRQSSHLSCGLHRFLLPPGFFVSEIFSAISRLFHSPSLQSLYIMRISKR